MRAEFSHLVMSGSATPWTVAHQAPLSMGIPGRNTGVQNTPLSRQEYSSVQARILEWVAMPSSRRSSQTKDLMQVSHIAGGFFTIWATREAQEYWSG